MDIILYAYVSTYAQVGEPKMITVPDHSPWEDIETRLITEFEEIIKSLNRENEFTMLKILYINPWEEGISYLRRSGIGTCGDVVQKAATYGNIVLKNDKNKISRYAAFT